MIRIGIVEDEKSQAVYLEKCLERFAQENQVSFQIDSYTDGMDLVEEYRPVYDILFLDIEMPLLDGMTAAERIRAKDPEVLMIFVTNLAQYAIRGYGVGALDYMLKPVTYPALALKLQKALRILAGRQSRSILIRYQDEIVKLPALAICYVEVRDHQLVYHTREREYREINTLRHAEESLGEGFARCNQCYLVNLRHVTGIRQDCVMVGEEPLRISRNRKKEFIQRLADACRMGGA